MNVQAVKGYNKFCLHTKGIWEITIQSCYKFEKESYTFDTSAPTHLVLNATHFLSRGVSETPHVCDNLLLLVNGSDPVQPVPNAMAGEFFITACVCSLTRQSARPLSATISAFGSR
jgi:hypothetical protein